MESGYENHILANYENAKDRIDDIHELVNFYDLSSIIFCVKALLIYCIIYMDGEKEDYFAILGLYVIRWR